MDAVNVKLAQRFVCPLARLRERVGERETGMASFIIRGGIFALPVNVKLAQRFVKKASIFRLIVQC